MKTRKYISTLTLASLLLILAACGGAEDKKAKLAELKTKRDKLDAEIRTLEAELKKSGVKIADNTPGIAVVVTPVAQGTFTHYLELQGKVDADENVTINADMPGTITSVYVTAGQSVSRGQVLAEIDNAVIKSGISEVEQQLSLARIVFEKQERLWNQKIGTEIQYLTAKSTVESMEKRKATLNEQLNMSKIKSPINGTVDEVFLKAGQIAAPGMPGIRIVNLGKLKVKAEVAETYVARVKKGSPVVLTFPDLNLDMSSTVDFAAKVINPLNRTFLVEVKIPHGNSDLRPNMVAKIQIADYTTENVIVIPSNIVRKDEDGSFVIVAVEETGKKVARKRVVTTGESSGGKFEIKSGLKPGDKVVTTGFQELNDGDILKY
jgi:membrane fusion protein, multidrug efflux system